VLCQADIQIDAPLCDDCSDGLPWIDPLTHCDLCGTPLAASGVTMRRCWRCESTSTPLLGVTAAVHLEEPVTGWVHAFKYPHARGMRSDSEPGMLLRALILEAATRAPHPLPDLVVPIPLHRRRLRERGFNQSALLARTLAQHFGLRLDCRALDRTRETETQTGLGRRARARNVRGAFCSRLGAPAPKRVWLVDDVTTTRATLESAARVLREAGVQQVAGVCVASRLET
jgi:ComF family protein